MVFIVCFSVKSKHISLSFLVLCFSLTFLDSIKLEWIQSNSCATNLKNQQSIWCFEMAEVSTNSCKIFKNKTLPVRQFHIWEPSFSSHILAWEMKFPHSQKLNGNSTLLFLSGGSQHMYQITTSLWVHVHLKIFPHLELSLYFSFYIIFMNSIIFRENNFSLCYWFDGYENLWTKILEVL